MAAPAAALIGQNLDLFALDTRDFGTPDDQPDPFTWRDENGEDDIEHARRERKAEAPALELVPKRDLPAPKQSLQQHVNGVDAILLALDELDELQGGAELDAERDELTAQLINAIAGTKAKVDAVSNVFAMFEGLEAAAAREVTRLQKRAARFAGQRERLTEYVLATLEASKLPKMDGDTSTLARRANPPAVVVDDFDALPKEYKKWAAPPPPPPPTANKAEIAKALKAKRDVPGARLVPSYRLVRS